MTKLVKTDALSNISTPEQMVMMFFESGVPIISAPKDISYRKSNSIIKTVNPLSLLQLKIIDGCFFKAMPRMNQDVVHVLDLDYFKWLISYNSNNNDFLKKAVTGIQQTLIQINIVDPDNPDLDFWHSTNYIYDVTITGKKFHFKIPESLRNHLHDPKSWTRLSLRIKNKFSSGYAYTIYDRCRLDQFRGATDWMTLEEFRTITNPDNPDQYIDFRNLQRRVIQIAVNQINEFSDILITPDYKKRGRTITHIRFVIEANPAYLSEEDKGNLPQHIFEILKKEFGFSNSEINTVAELDMDFVMEKIEFVRYRMEQKNIENPTRYLLNAINEDLRLTPSDKKKIEKTKEAATKHLFDEAEKTRRKTRVSKSSEKLDAFESLDETKKQEILDKFKNSEEYLKIKSVVMNSLDINKPIIKTAFKKFLEL
ncbi:replication initiation protein [Methylotenera sp.]|uniref:replication initiation protein n=1 Tax=Methylotenera sp. TaxID=2051956 RepID=UPI002ED9492C